MIVLLGSTGYIGQAFERELARRGTNFISLSRSQINYADFEVLHQFLAQNRPTFLINCAGYTGKPNVDACETAKADTLQGNTLLPVTIAHACVASSIPWGHVSSGCIYAGAKVARNGSEQVEKDLTQPALKKLLAENRAAIRGFTEADSPNFTFSDPSCSFYSGTKALGEEAIQNIGQNYLWRLRIPFDEFDSSRNYLSKVQRYARVYDNVNSVSHRADFVNACLDLWNVRAPFGIYNITNQGFVTTREVVAMIQRILKPKRDFSFWENDEEFYKSAAKTPRSNCVLDNSKLLAAGVQMRPVEAAIEDSLKNWQPGLSTLNSHP
jgi:dTDP-4-dehydrorhamnose reductase